MSSDQTKIAVVTGANTGLGFETCLGLAREGYTVVLACRDETKAQGAMERIKGRPPSARLDFIPLDLIDRDSIARFAETFSARYDHLNTLVNNAGVMGPPYTITANDLELQFDAKHPHPQEELPANAFNYSHRAAESRSVEATPPRRT